MFTFHQSHTYSYLTNNNHKTLSFSNFSPPNDLLPADEHPIKGFSIVCTSPNKIHKPKIRQILNLFSSIQLSESSSANIPVTVYLVKCEGFWEKHIEQCTKSQIKDDPIIMTSKSRLTKYFNAVELPEELGGTLAYNHGVWLNSRLVSCWSSCLNGMRNIIILIGFLTDH